MHFSDIRQHWQQALSDLYPAREIDNLFRYVLEDVFDLSPSEQLIQREQEQPAGMLKQLDGILDRLLTGEPLQYITGFTYFDDLKIGVSPAVLIPRPETEELVHWVLESVPAGFSGTIVDWCTGSGCIALALKNRLPNATVSGLDWSEAALQQAGINAESLGLPVHFERKDALAEIVSAEQVEVIVSNPPYIPEQEKAIMRTNVNDFEPHMALFVPDDQALLFYEAITQLAIAQLKPGGWLFFELHEDFAAATRTMVEATGAFSHVEIRKDLSGKDRMLKAAKA
jgi:release factor glutamine methyltransferase